MISLEFLSTFQLFPSALVATFLTLTISGFLATFFVDITNLSGRGSEDALSLQFGVTSLINLRGLLLGGIIIGALGVLDDITTSQTAAVFELSKASPTLKAQQLFERGMNIGKEHIASLVNTLVLAYAGVAMPLFIFLVLNPRNQPTWIWLNSEMISEEIVRTLAGSFGLVLAVPISTFLASWAIKRFPSK